MKPKIFEIGHGRTGTNSLTAAMRILGYRCIHGLHGKTDPKDVIAKTMAGRCDWKLLDRFDFVSNFPLIAFRELERSHPEAKFILTVRDPVTWLDSIRRQFSKTTGPIRDAGRNRLTAGVVLRLIVFGQAVFSEGRMAERFSSHNRAVMEYFQGKRRRKLLKLNIPGGDEWEPLCEFLGCDVPAVPFPWARTYKQAQEYKP